MARGIDTKCIHLEEDEGQCSHYGALSYPIYQTATYAHPGVGQSTGFDYSRLQNPTREHLEKMVAALENGIDAFALSSGMAAISLLMELFRPGDHIIADSDLYGGSIRLFHHVNEKNGVEFSGIDCCRDDVESYVKENTKAIYIETLGNPNSDVVDIEALAKTLNVDEAWLMGFDSPMEPQSANVSNENRFNSDDERTLILSYRKLNDKNKKKCYIYTNTLLTNQQMEDELIVKAAHKYANVDVTEEMKQHADDIMNNPSEWE